MAFNIDLGTGVLLIMAFVISISIMGAWQAYGFMVMENCSDHIEEKITKWRGDMNAPAALRGIEADWIILGRDCVEYVEDDGIKFKGADELTRFGLSADRHMKFEFTSEKLGPRDAPYDVTVDEIRGAVIFRGA